MFQEEQGGPNPPSLTPTRLCAVISTTIILTQPNRCSSHVAPKSQDETSGPTWLGAGLWRKGGRRDQIIRLHLVNKTILIS